MIEQHIDICTADGAMNSFVVRPEEGGPHPLVLFFMDALGKREELHTMARRLATVGYCVVLPNLYYRDEREFFVLERTDPLVARMMQLMQSLTNARVVRDALAVLDWADADGGVDAHRVGAVGYCMSGPFVMAIAAGLPERLKAIAAFHPALMVTDRADSPHLMAPQIRCETYLGCAETDPWFTPEMVTTLKAALVAGGTPHRLEHHPGTEHGFVFPARAGIYNLAAAERHWERLFDLLGRNLPVR